MFYRKFEGVLCPFEKVKNKEKSEKFEINCRLSVLRSPTVLWCWSAGVFGSSSPILSRRGKTSWPRLFVSVTKPGDAHRNLTTTFQVLKVATPYPPLPKKN